jgi:hypothetical protein
MARAIMGGLGFSALVSLLIVPLFYVWFDDLNLWRRRVFSKGLIQKTGGPSITSPSELPQSLN